MKVVGHKTKSFVSCNTKILDRDKHIDLVNKDKSRYKCMTNLSKQSFD